MQARVPLTEAMGIRPVRERARQALVALRGEEDVPPSRWGLSSLAQLRPKISLPLWRGRAPVPRKAIVTNLYNHTPTPIDAGWSVKKTQVRDFRGGALTYDSHNGTDFTIPIGTTVVAAAPGRVVHLHSEFNRGGLKLYLDHGDGLMTTYAHLARALVSVGDVLERGQPIALSGYSGIDGVVTFPWGTPHVHFNAWLDATPVDPFPHGDAVSLWRAGALPVPPDDAEVEPYVPSTYDEAAVDALVASCVTPSVREELAAVPDLATRAERAIIARNYYPTRFPGSASPYAARAQRRPRLDLPFSAEDFDGIVFADEI